MVLAASTSIARLTSLASAISAHLGSRTRYDDAARRNSPSQGGKDTRWLSFALIVIGLTSGPAAAQSWRPPAVPLVTHDPYFSIWSMNDHLTDGPTRHWTGLPQPLTGLIRIDGRTFRWMGEAPESAPAMKQTDLEVTPTRTIYSFKQQGVKLEASFLSPLVPSDMDLMSRPISYLNLSSSATDGKPHNVQLLLEVSSLLAVDTYTQQVVWSRSRLQGITMLRAADFDQPVLGRSGDNLRIDWGCVFLGVPDQPGATTVTELPDSVEKAFAAGKSIAVDAINMPQRADQAATLSAVFDLSEVTTAPAARHVLLGYDDVYSIEYMHRSMRAYWRRNGMDTGALVETAERDYPEIDRRTRDFDAQLTAELEQVGGPAYTELATLAFRQTIAAHKLVADIDGEPMLFPKENFSNGCISTVDVIYPSSPFFLLFNPELVKAQLRPLLEYVQTGRWQFPFAPHDLGTYPKADGQVYGGGETSEEDQMPVEESGNMLLMFAALAKAEGNAEFANRYWSQLREWAEYLKSKGLDPANQLSTDDFAGHLAHNANLSIKAILALDGYATLADKTGRSAEAAEYQSLAQHMAKQWVELAQEGDHYRLAFDQPGTWSQKYNLVWDQILDFNLFPPSVRATESRFYRSHLNEFGLPLDNRRAWTKLDWEVWTATLAGNRQDFDAILFPIQRFVNESPSRVPLTDWYWTTDAKQVGFQARSVVGGVYIPLLANEQLWQKWSRKSAARASAVSGPQH
jgi:Domain of unknown function (DUF4965)/Domain of unknown function (DUF1793)/Domain of unknown function (DUF5127)/Domain of unknown function (DUF4964)